MFDYRRIALWLAVLLVPGGLLLLPMLIVDWRRRNANKKNAEQNAEQKAEAPVSHTMPPLAA